MKNAGKTTTTPITKEQLTDERIEKMASEAIESIADHLLASNNGSAGVIEVHADLFLNLLREVQKYRKAGSSPVIPEDWIAAVNRLLDSDGSRGCYRAIEVAEARRELEQLLAAQQVGSVSN
ncbi:TPA: hypothetical protein ACHTSK_004647 [Escherichia coli]|uniref:hypothetical protein n=1 Tax=Escherichia coli TaxID=562 RepID=UPI0019C2D7F2|nr:hypothetical protein [Escherichia coli]MEB5674151.1 hypothetical protein [Escherichia coli]